MFMESLSISSLIFFSFWNEINYLVPKGITKYSFSQIQSFQKLRQYLHLYQGNKWNNTWMSEPRNTPTNYYPANYIHQTSKSHKFKGNIFIWALMDGRQKHAWLNKACTYRSTHTGQSYSSPTKLNSNEVYGGVGNKNKVCHRSRPLPS